jgi:hypothetical protein
MSNNLRANGAVPSGMGAKRLCQFVTKSNTPIQRDECQANLAFKLIQVFHEVYPCCAPATVRFGTSHIRMQEEKLLGDENTDI